jgi:ABC-type multidrug transport system fused ATPase/permease subunit
MFGADIALKFLKENPRYIVTNLFFMLIIPILELYVPKLYSKLFENPSKHMVFQTIFNIVVLLMVFQVLKQLNSYNNDVQYYKLDNEINKCMIHNVFSKEKAKKNGELFTSNLMFYIHRGQDMARYWYYNTMRFVIPYILFFMVSTIYLSYINIKLGLPMLMLFISNIFLILGSAYGCKKDTLKLSESFDKVITETEDILSNLQSIQSEGKEQHELDIIKQVLEDYELESRNMIACVFKYNLIGTVILCLFLVIIMYISYDLYSTNKITLATLLTVFFIIKQNQDSNKRLMYLVEMIGYDYGAAKTLGDILKVPTTSFKSLPKAKLTKVNIEFKNVKFKYPNTENNILNNVSFKLKNKDRLAIVGDIGSGKSTILRLIMKLYQHNNGHILLNNKDYKQLSTIDIFSNVGYMPQNPVLFNRNIIDNIKYGREHLDDEEIIRLLKEFNVYEQFTNLEHGLYTRIGKGGSKISGGQKQIIWFLRILLKNPPLLILDEPTSSLDKKTKDIMSGLIEKVLSDKTIIMVTHDDFLMKFANKTIELKEGKIIKDTSNENSYNLLMDEN